MAATAADLARMAPGHWAARPLPEPPRHKRVSKTGQPPGDAIGQALEEWMHELTIGNTIDAE